MADRGPSDFINNALKNGGFRVNRFRIKLFAPAVAGLDTAAVQYQATASTVPARTLEPAEAFYLGRQIKVAGDYTIPDWPCTLVIDRFETYEALSKWQDAALSLRTNVADNDAPASYFGSGELELLDRKDQVIKTIHLDSIWPTEVSELSLDYSQNNEIGKANVVFAINEIS